jgi:hypothetical protein
MDLNDAFLQARILLDNEIDRSTITYRYTGHEWPEELRYDQWLRNNYLGLPQFAANNYALPRMRKKPLREVVESPDRWELASTNYDLMMAIYGQLRDSDRPIFLGGLLDTYTHISVHARAEVSTSYPCWNGRTSALPLLAELCIRNGMLDLLLKVLNQLELPNSNVAVLMVHLQEIISLNFDVFSPSELDSFPEQLARLHDIAKRQTWKSKNLRLIKSHKTVTNPDYKPGFEQAGTAVVQGIDAFLKQCAKARYFYLKGALQRSGNLEIESDKKTVEDFLSKLGFSPLMVQSLNEAEQLYRTGATAFELKSCLSHLRSFLEQLHMQGAKAAALPGESAPDKWGAATTFLRNHEVITLKTEQFITPLYTLVSDEAVHPLIAERQYARLFRNIVIEYGLLFLSTLEKKGLSLTLSS